MKPPIVKPRFFATPAAFRSWLEKNHVEAVELWVGFHKTGTGKPSITWPESVDEALCFGWIDGIRKRIDEASYTIRFTRRKPTSVWSAVNIRKMAVLIEQGRVVPAGLAAFAKRSEEKSKLYSYEQRHTAQLDGNMEKQFRANKLAWDHWQSRPPWYRRTATHWVVSAKKDETRQKRLAILIACCAKGEAIPELKRMGR